ncbi:hypothetical protein BM526_20395 (plasmid) [Alteromonas mediterranea]|uniref:hypothetical protein n=1 Tax=Alteromonas mediterranea TaxID=314275 RepID=UPI0009035408|nr:hypothetical protein [Alteromonas mediterranea]APE04334.1 hypothetical protein BM526_20395 [Alteromonas mediterranea]
MPQVIEQKHEKVVFRLANGVEFHVAIDEENKLKIQCASDIGSPAMSVEPRSDNAITLTQRV